MRRILIFIFGVVCSVCIAQRATGYGRGSDYNTRGIGGYSTLYFMLFVLLVTFLYLIYTLIKSAEDGKEWSYSQFCSKYPPYPRIGYRKDATFIGIIVFEASFGDDILVYLDESCGYYITIDDIRYDSSTLYIKKIKDKYIMFKK